MQVPQALMKTMYLAWIQIVIVVRISMFVFSLIYYYIKLLDIDCDSVESFT